MYWVPVMCQAYCRYWSESNQQNKNSCPLYIHLSREKNPNSQPIFSSVPSCLCLFSLGLFNSGLSREMKSSSRSLGLPLEFNGPLGGPLSVSTVVYLGLWSFSVKRDQWLRGNGRTWGMEQQTYWLKIQLRKGTHYCERDKTLRYVGNVSGCTQLY